MKKLLLLTYRFMTLTLVLCLYNVNVLAADLNISSLNEKIPITAEAPSIAEILRPLPLDSPRPSCNKTFPEPELIFGEKTEVSVGDVEFIRYYVSIDNKEDYPDYLFNESPGLPPCGLNTNSSRTWVQFYDENDDYIYGFCALPSSDLFDGLWFAHKKTELPPSKVSVVLRDRLCNKEYKSAAIALQEITIAPGAPVIAGIGLVPRTFINQTNGLATTGSEHPINVLDAPFGTSLRFMGNIDRLRSLGVTRYTMGYCDMGQHDCNAFFSGGFILDEWKFIDDVKTNYFWSTFTNKYVLHRETPTEIINSGAYIIKAYSVPSPAIAWYFDNLLFDWVTQGSVKVPSGLYKVHLFGFKGQILNPILVNISADESTMVVRIDNTPPLMTINSIEYNGVPISSCSIVNLTNAADSIEFNITATDPDGYLLNYALRGEYGDNQHLTCVAEDYAAYLADGNSGPVWPGASPSTTYSCAGFPKTCAYSYHISGWDRAINGYHRIHYVDDFKTLTIQLPAVQFPDIPKDIIKEIDNPYTF